MEKKICNLCGHSKELNEFVKGATTADGYTGRCKKCMAILSKKRRDKENTGQYTAIELSQKPDDAEAARQVLIRLGYDFDQEKSIHEQFLERIATKYGGL